MKLNKLASAVSVSLVALALTACGSDNDSKPATHTPQVDKQGQNQNQDQGNLSDEAKNIATLKTMALTVGLSEAEATKFANENKAIAASSPEIKTKLDLALAAKQKPTENNPVSEVVTKTNEFIDPFNAKARESVSASPYSRQEDSNFDRVANPAERSSTGVVSFDTNVNVQNPYLSNFVLGVESFKPREESVVDVVGAIVDANGTMLTKEQHKSVGSVFAYSTATKAGAERSVNTENDLKTLQDENRSHVEVGATDGADVIKAAKSGVRGDNDGQTGLVAYSAKYNSVSSDSLPVFGLEENIYQYNKDTKQLDVANKNMAFKVVGADGKVTKEVANNKTTRVFGKNYQTYDNGAVIDVNNTKINSYQGVYDAKGELAGIPSIKLHNVQYGRITANIDALAKDPNENRRDFAHREFLAHGAATSVDKYFYRGTNSTSIADMNAVKAKGEVLKYQGHALTYNVGPTVSNSNDQTIPTAYGFVQPSTIGNFVEATFDTKTSKVVGSVYNFNNADVNSRTTNFVKQDLIKFNGDVHGNTVVGQSVKQGTNEVGSLTASFYGKNAEELGGSVNSITRDKGYGVSNWGAVFGAQQVKDVKPTIGQNFDIGQANQGAQGSTTNPVNP